MKIFYTAAIAISTVLLTTSFTDSRKSQTSDGELQWFTHINDAQSVSKSTNKPIFAFFTGSDWCGWCMRLQANVFHKPEFKEWAKENVVLLELDFPRRKQLTPEQAAHNNQLRGFFKPRGFPTVWIFTMNPNEETSQYEINALGSLGYPNSQPGKEAEAFIANANRILANVAE
jgi:protein disulfide-isomerase